MYFRVNLKMKKATFRCCFTWIALTELNFSVAFLSIRKTWYGQFVGKVGGMAILKNGGIILKWWWWWWWGLIFLYGL